MCIFKNHFLKFGQLTVRKIILKSLQPDALRLKSTEMTWDGATSEPRWGALL